MSEVVTIDNRLLYEATTGKAQNVFRPDIMLDRVINIKINYDYFDEVSGLNYPMQSIVIRSDYEAQGGPLFFSANRQQAKIINRIAETDKMPVFEKVRIKPDIRLKYRGYGSTGVKFDVTVGNFFALVQDFALELNSTSQGIKIQSIEVLFGYMSQFPDLTLLKGTLGRDVYYDFTNIMYSYASYIKGDVLYWYRSASPPDGEYTFSCAVASIKMPAEQMMGNIVRTGVYPEETREAMLRSYRYFVESNGFTLRSVLEWYITRHYVRNAEDAQIRYLYADTMELMPLNSYRYGVQVFIMSPKIFTAFSKDFAQTLLPLAPTAVGMLNTIKSMLYPYLDYRFGLDGNIYIYDTREHWGDPKFLKEYTFFKPDLNRYNETIRNRSSAAMADLRGDIKPLENRKKLLPLSVPAVYDLQYGPITVMVTPFFGLVDMGQELSFNAAYSVAVNQLASIDTRVPVGEVTYTVLYYDIDFSTVSEYNTMSIYCVAGALTT